MADQSLNKSIVCVLIQYEYSSSPILRQLSPLALRCGEKLRITGDLYAVDFSDPDDAGRDSQRDFFTRILAGGLVCSHVDANGTK